MHESASARVELVHGELRLIPRGGPKPMRLATLPNLRELSRVDSSLRPVEVGKQMSVWLRRNIKTLRAQELGGKPVDQITAQTCIELILGYDCGWMSLSERRVSVLNRLRIPFSEAQMRRSHSPEFALLRKLAEHLVSTSAT